MLKFSLIQLFVILKSEKINPMPALQPSGSLMRILFSDGTTEVKSRLSLRHRLPRDGETHAVLSTTPW